MVKHSAKPLGTRQSKQWLTILQSSGASENLGVKTSPSIVLDTNVWYSAIVYGQTPERVLRHCLEHYQIVVSVEILDELFDHLKHLAKAPQRWIRLALLALERRCWLVPVNSTDSIKIRDPKDTHIIQAAIAGRAKIIVTGDKDLLELGSYANIRIITPAQFIKDNRVN